MINLTINLGTVALENGKEMPLAEYCKYLRDGICDNTITYFNYDIKAQKLVYEYDNKLYSLTIDDDNLDIIADIASYYNLKRNVDISTHNENVKQDTLLNNAKNGIIETEEVKELYLKDLKNKRKKLLLGELEFVNIIDYNDSKVASNIGETLIGISFLYTFILCPNFIVFGVGSLKTLLLFEIIAITMMAGAAITAENDNLNYANPFVLTTFLISKILNYIIGLIPSIIKSITKIIKNGLPEIKLINEKIKYLKKYKISRSNENTKIDTISKDKSLESCIQNVYLALSKLDKENQQVYLIRISSELNMYSERLRLIPDNSPNKKEYENSIRLEFIDYLVKLEKEINASLSIDNSSLDNVIKRMQADFTSGDYLEDKGRARTRRINDEYNDVATSS